MIVGAASSRDLYYRSSNDSRLEATPATKPTFKILKVTHMRRRGNDNNFVAYLKDITIEIIAASWTKEMGHLALAAQKLCTFCTNVPFFRAKKLSRKPDGMLPKGSGKG